MFKKILIANRAEIALRVIRACKEMGILTVAIHSEADKDCLHVKNADESICIGPAESNASYLNIPNIISAAEVSGADAIHPGYGFLAENAYFAEVCESCGIKFIGPSKDVIVKMGDKSQARKTMRKAGVPIIPGSEGIVSKIEDAVKICKKIKYPVVVKASAGGGGKGMRIVQNEEALENAMLTAQAEAKAAFGKADLYIEKFIEEPRHIEFQIMADVKGNIIYLPERDCSIQRRHQKLLEESPSPSVSTKLRKRMGKAACKVAKAVKYVTVGTVEFLVDKKGDFYFMEMNTRIQVEHPVTELVTGIDLVKEQIRLAAGGKIDIDQDDIKIRGHALECRINAEDPNKDFIPIPGVVTQFIAPGGFGVRVDSHLYAGYEIPTYYDSLIAKLITFGRNRQESIEHMQRALGEFVIEGIKTTIPFHQRVLNNAFFRKGEVYTNFIQKRLLGEK
ncbi:MAG: acetyl-CoA carboxylase biotin carboxylase subunit [bacterium]